MSANSYNNLELKASLARRNITGMQLAEHLKITCQTMYSKMSTGGFTLDEVTEITDFLDLSEQEFKLIFFPQFYNGIRKTEER